MADIDIDEFRGYLKINRHFLDDEIINQPQLYFEVSEAYADAVSERDAYKELIATVDAKLFKTLPAVLEAKGSKTTEAAIKAAIQRSKEHSDAFYDWLEAKNKADKLGNLMESFHQRGNMLKELVNLHNSNYFSTDAIKRNEKMQDFMYEKRITRLHKPQGVKGKNV